MIAAHVCDHTHPTIDRARTVRVNLCIAFVGLVGMRHGVLAAVDTKFHDFQ